MREEGEKGLKKYRLYDIREERKKTNVMKDEIDL